MARKVNRPGPSEEFFADMLGHAKAAQGATAHAAELRKRYYAEFDPGQLYVIEFGAGVTKVGKARRASDRIATHARYGEVIGNGIVRSWASEKHPGISGTEAKLIAFAKVHGTSVSGEYFTDLPFELATAYAELIVGECLTECLRQADADRFEYLRLLTAAVQGDLSKTWEQAREALALQGGI